MFNRNTTAAPGQAKRTALRATFTLLGAALLTSVAPPVMSDLAQSAGLDDIAMQLDSYGVAEAAFIRRSKIRQKTTSGYRVVVVVGDDSTNNEVNTVDVAIAPLEGSPAPDCDSSITLPLKVVKENGNKRFVFNQLDFDENSVNFSYTVTVTMRNELGEPVGEPMTETVEVEDDGDTRLRSVRIRQLDESNYELRTTLVGDWDKEVGSVDVIFSDFSGSQPIPGEISLTESTTTDGKRVFTTSTLTFEDPAFAADEVYNLVVDLRNHDGSSLGSSEHVE